LRGKAEVLESALRILRGDEDPGSALRPKGEILEHSFAIAWEETVLLLLDRNGDRPGLTLAREHAGQRALRERPRTLHAPSGARLRWRNT
jgi:hypothetical protein